jgi:hypothetical protein
MLAQVRSGEATGAGAFAVAVVGVVGVAGGAAASTQPSEADEPAISSGTRKRDIGSTLAHRRRRAFW